MMTMKKKNANVRKASMTTQRAAVGIVNVLGITEIVQSEWDNEDTEIRVIDGDFMLLIRSCTANPGRTSPPPPLVLTLDDCDVIFDDA